MDAATLLAEREQALAQVRRRLALLEQEQQQLLQGVLRLEGACEALRTLAETSDVPDASVVDPASALAPALPWERS